MATWTGAASVQNFETDFQVQNSWESRNSDLVALQEENANLRLQLARMQAMMNTEPNAAAGNELVEVPEPSIVSRRTSQRRPIDAQPARRGAVYVPESNAITDVPVTEVEVSKLKQWVHTELAKCRDETAESIEFDTAPRSTPDFIQELLPSMRGAPFYLVNLSVVVDKYLLWKRKLPRAEPFYAIKSNPDPEIARVLHILGAGFDCASQGELEQVLGMGCPASKIIFANPCKRVDHIQYAKENGVEKMTFDNMLELEKIHAHFPEAKLVLRILPDDSYSLMPFGIKFGATFEDSVKLIERCRELNMNLIGVSFHVGSGCFSSVAWVEALKLARRVFDEAARFGYDMDFLDLGGGWPGVETDALRFAQVGEDISPVIDQLFPEHVRVIAEPGRYFCTECTTLVTSIVGKRERVVTAVGQEPEKEVQYYMTDSVYASFNCIIFDHAHPEPNYLVDVSDRKVLPCCIFGATCDSMDKIMPKGSLPELYIGEVLYWNAMGAYTSAPASAFNGFPVPKSHYFMTSN